MTKYVEPSGPAVFEQLTPVTPEMVHDPVPVGVSPVVGPDTVAVKVKVEPTVAVGVLVVMVTLGASLAMTIEALVLGPAAA